MRKIIIAIDGYSACGKSTTAKEVANVFHYRYIDSGAMYRAVTLYFIDHHVALTNPKEVEKALSNIKVTFRTNVQGVSETYLNNLTVEKEIREMRVASKVSEVSALAPVRKAMVEQQRKLGKDKGVVMDGRDIGTVVFPKADLKMFLTANIMVRAYRRQQELLEKDELIDLPDIIANLQKRDHLDSTRKESPLVQAKDSILMDTSHITIDEEVDEVVRLAMSRIISR
jgi:cytidylate kinase